MASEVRKLPDGSSAEVATMYVGLGQAYYVKPNAPVAGVGRPGPEGWVWTAANEVAERVASAIAVFRNEKPAAYVPLPVKVS